MRLLAVGAVLLHALLVVGQSTAVPGLVVTSNTGVNFEVTPVRTSFRRTCACHAPDLCVARP